jgi:outer membrane protein OmpA-like peptidoglycan-associated protein
VPLDLLLSDLEKLKGKEKPGSAGEPSTPDRPWYASIQKVEVAGWGVAVEDRTLPEPGRITLDDIAVTIDDLSNQKDATAAATIALRINQTGAVQVSGSAGINPPTADMTIVSDKIALKSFQPYVDAAVNAQIESGTTSAEGKILFNGNDGQPQIRYEGDLSLDGLAINDRLQPQDFLKLERLEAEGIVLELKPNRLHATEVSIHKPYARITVDQNGAVNVVQSFSPVNKEAVNGEENLLQRLADMLIAQFKGPMPMSVEMIQLHDFSADFIDESITPHYTTQLGIRKGSVRGLSSDPSERADFKIEGRIDRSAALDIAGTTNPLNALQYTLVDLALSGFTLQPVSPYSAKYIGYKIDQGKLNLNLKYAVDEKTIKGKNRIEIDQLELGEKIDSPDAPNLPIALGVALLKGIDGRIELDVPVAGNLSDPRFNVGSALANALTKPIDDASSAPFSTLPELDGFKGEELGLIEFEAGLAALNPRSTRKLNALARFLNEKKSLKLAVEGTADRQKDGTAISGEQALETTLRNGRQATVAGQGDAAKDQFVDELQLEQLAESRAEQVRDHLIQQGKIAAARIEFRDVRILDATGGNSGQVNLFLNIQ